MAITNQFIMDDEKISLKASFHKCSMAFSTSGPIIIINHSFLNVTQTVYFSQKDFIVNVAKYFMDFIVTIDAIAITTKITIIIA
jgi:hypothetical protein